MADSEQPIISRGSNARSVERCDESKEESKQKSLSKSQQIRKYDGRDIDEMKLIELKDALRGLNIATIGNKNELKMRLRNVLVQKRQVDIASDKDARTDDEKAKDEEITDKDEASGNENEERETRRELTKRNYPTK